MEDTIDIRMVNFLLIEVSIILFDLTNIRIEILSSLMLLEWFVIVRVGIRGLMDRVWDLRPMPIT